MKHTRQQRVLSILVLIPLVLALLFPSGAMADDLTPPPPADETQPTEPPPPVETEPPPTEEAPTDEAPADAAPTEDVPTAVEPTDVVPTDAVITEAAPTDPASTEAAPTEAALTELAPTDLLPTEMPPTEAAPVDSGPTDATLSAEAAAEAEPTVGDIVEAASDAGVTLTDAVGEPIEMGTLSGAETLLSGDPYFTSGGVTYRFLPTGGDCSSYAAGTCFTSDTPIQDAIDYAATTRPTGIEWTDPYNDHVTRTIHPIYVETGTYNEQLIITDTPNLEDLALWGGGPSSVLPSVGAGADAAVLDGSTLSGPTIGIDVQVYGFTLINFVVENFDIGIHHDVTAGNTPAYIENNTIQDNGTGMEVIGHKGKPGPELHFNIFSGNDIALQNQGDSNNLQYLQAQSNYWGCDEGPEIVYQTEAGTRYRIWASPDTGGPNGDGEYIDDPYPECAKLSGTNDFWNHQINTKDYSPFKINLGPLAGPPPYCGDGHIDEGEDCDPAANPTGAPEHYTCLGNCTTQYVPWCGDGHIDAGEDCDPAADPTGAPVNYICLPNCTTQYAPYCGDGHVDPGEACDPNAVPTGAPDHYRCLANCTTEYVPWCGDGHVDPGEACDPNAVPTGAPEYYICQADCTTEYVPWCGDGHVDPGEACDPNAVPTGAPEDYVCLTDCTTKYAPYCGNEQLDEGEECDPTADPTGAPEHYICLANCTTDYVPWCGDGHVDPGEACDPEADPTGAPDHYICLADCRTQYVPYCGDGRLDPGETCDPPFSRVDEHHVCNANCQVQYEPYCGDGIVNQRSEQCDGSAPADQTCTEDCKLLTPSTPIAPLGGVFPVLTEDIAAGYAHTCAITLLGGVQCWGDNGYGQLGDGTFTNSDVPVEVVGLDSGRQIVAGANHTCLLDGTDVWCWGLNDVGQIGDGTTTNRNTPVLVLSGASYITAGADYTCAALLGGGMMCWGNNSNGQLGDGTHLNHSKPTLASLISGVSGADGGQSQTCALTPTGQISCWTGGLIPVTGGMAQSHRQVSANRFGSQVIGVDSQGVPITIDEQGATPMSSLSGVVDVDSGADHVCALLGGGSVKCWGGNNYGQLGNNSTLASSNPVSVLNLGAALDMAVGRNHACAILVATMQNTLIRCWGLNSDGQLGNDSTLNSSVPVDVKFMP